MHPSLSGVVSNNEDIGNGEGYENQDTIQREEERNVHEQHERVKP